MFNRGKIYGELFPADLQYIGTTVNTANQTNYTFSGVDIGTPGDNRIVVVGATTNFGIIDITVDGVSLIFPQATHVQTKIGYKKITTGTSATVVVRTNGGTNQNCRIWVYTVQGESEEHLDNVQSLGVTGPVLTLSGLETRQGGAVIYCYKGATTRDFTYEYSGMDTLSQNQKFATESLTMNAAHSTNVTGAQTVDMTYTLVSSTDIMGAAAISF